jgi:hypothetical protein
MARPRNPLYRKFLESWPELSGLSDKVAAGRLGVSLRTYQHWTERRRNPPLGDPWHDLYCLLEQREQQPPGPYRDGIDLKIAQIRWFIDKHGDDALYGIIG